MFSGGTVFFSDPAIVMSSNHLVPAIGFVGDADPGVCREERHEITKGICVYLGARGLSIAMEFYGLHSVYVFPVIRQLRICH